MGISMKEARASLVVQASIFVAKELASTKRLPRWRLAVPDRSAKFSRGSPLRRCQNVRSDGLQCLWEPPLGNRGLSSFGVLRQIAAKNNHVCQKTPVYAGFQAMRP